MVGFDDDASGAGGGLGLHFDVAELFESPAALLAHFHEGADASFVASASVFDAFAEPGFFDGEFFVE